MPPRNPVDPQALQAQGATYAEAFTEWLKWEAQNNPRSPYYGDEKFVAQ